MRHVGQSRGDGGDLRRLDHHQEHRSSAYIGLGHRAEAPGRVLLLRGGVLDGGRRHDAAAGRIGEEGGFLRHAENAAARYGLDTRAVLVAVGRRKMVGGQEDMITDIALDLKAAAEAGTAN